MIDLTQERDVRTLRQISLLLERENQRLITKTLELTAENARLHGLPDSEKLALAELRALEQRRAQLLAPAADTPSTAPPSRPSRPGHGPRLQPTLPVVELRYELPPDQRACPACAGELTEMAGQTEDSEPITTDDALVAVRTGVFQAGRFQGLQTALARIPASPTPRL